MDVGVKVGDGVGEAVGPVAVAVGVEVLIFMSSGFGRGREKNGPHAEAMSTNPAITNTKKNLWIIDLPHNKFITTKLDHSLTFAATSPGVIKVASICNDNVGFLFRSPTHAPTKQGSSHLISNTLLL